MALVLLGGVPIVYTEEILNTDRSLRVEFFVEEPPEEPAPSAVRPRIPPIKRPAEVRPKVESPRDLVLPRPPEPPPVEAKRPEPERTAPESAPDPPPVPTVTSANFDLPEAPRRPAAKPSVRIDLLEEGNSAPPTVGLPPKKVQTGGFGDPDGVPSTRTARNPVHLASLGSFDLPEGPGHGDGTGGASGVRGIVASAGFGNGVATTGSAPAHGDGRGGVRPGSFADAAHPVAAATRPKPRPVEAALVPIEIVSKPKPAYTEEARSRRLEGEVVLDVLFEATGQPRVLRVVKGLGYGLDESAVRAAEQIRFRPARRDGQAVDYTARVRMVFQLA